MEIFAYYMLFVVVVVATSVNKSVFLFSIACGSVAI